MKHLTGLVMAASLSLAAATTASAEVDVVNAAQQYGLSSLPLMIMEDGKLVEKHAKRLGIDDLTVNWVRLGNPGAITEALVSGSIDFGSGGVPSLLVLWSRTKGTPMEVHGAGAIVNMPMELLTTNPDVETIADFTEEDRIAVTTVKVSNQAMLLQMASAAEFGQENYDRLDHLTVSLPHPEATATLLSGSGVISAHFSALPFQHQQKQDERVRRITSSYEILGGPATNTTAFSTKRFRDENPTVYEAYTAALQEAIEQINADKRAAAETYVRMTGTNQSVDEIHEIISAPDVEMTFTPHQTMKMANFMAEIGRLDPAPADWKELFFDNVHDLPGS